MPDDMRTYRDVFLSESAEYVQSIVDGMLRLEKVPDDLEPVEVVFRGAHSLKGMAAAMGYERTADLTHKMESLMDTVRGGAQSADRGLVDLMLRAADAVRLLIDDEANDRVAFDAGAILAELAARTQLDRGSTLGMTAEGESVFDVTSRDGDGGAEVLVTVSLEESCVLKSVRAYMVIKRLSHIGRVVETHPSARDIEDENFGLSFEVVLQTPRPAADVAKAVEAVSEVASAEVADRARSCPIGPPAYAEDEAHGRFKNAIPKLSETQTVRIAIGHLDTLVNLVGEIVTVRSRLENLISHDGSPDVREALEDLGRISSDLQHEVMQTRMVPVGNIFNRFPRMVRDLSCDLGKDIEFEMEGLGIELDRTVLDEVGDPLVHLLRNAIDHGIEPSGVRVASGKSPRGTVRLSASRERDQIRLVVSDDGRGIDEDLIWAKAVERGLVTPQMREGYPAADILMLTCAPGFSTTEVATKVSGRGVGMDVVRGKIQHLGGSLSIRSEPGVGSEFVLSLPLTLAIVQTLLVGSGEQVFALPLSFVSEVLSRDEMDLDTIEGSPVLSLRDGSVVPVYRLDVLIGAHADHARAPEDSEHIVIVEVGDQIRGLTVGSLIGRQEVVIKPLARALKQAKGLGGATVLGDGSVALILDPRMMFSMGD